MSMYQTELETAIRIARLAGDIIRQYFDGDQHEQTKDDGSPVTIADKMINALVIDELGKSFPEDGVIGEEASTTTHGPGRKWICDPLDGTKAFTWGVPTSTFSLALVIDGRPVVGVVYDPFLDKLYTGIKGEGSFCNDERLCVSDKSLEDGLVALASDVKEIARLPYTLSIPKPITFSGAAYKCMLVARGRLVGFVEAGITDHDVAAAQVIIEEAGGKITDMHGHKLDYTQPFAGVILSNGRTHDALVALVNA